jgi:uncharacterized protein YjlB
MLKVTKKMIPEDNHFPGNPALPLLHYQGAFNLKGKNGAATIKKIFIENFWLRPWLNGIYDFHHYHSNNHEALGIARGTCVVQMGGENGIFLELARGDALIIPAGVSHKRIESSKDFSCVGAYSIDTDYDMKYGKAGELNISKKKISSLPLPDTDPVFGEEGPLRKYWK